MMMTMLGRRRIRPSPTAAPAAGVVPGIVEEPNAAPAAPAARRRPVPPRKVRRGIDAPGGAGDVEWDDDEVGDCDLVDPWMARPSQPGDRAGDLGGRSRGSTGVVPDASDRGDPANAGCAYRPLW